MTLRECTSNARSIHTALPSSGHPQGCRVVPLRSFVRHGSSAVGDRPLETPQEVQPMLCVNNYTQAYIDECRSSRPPAASHGPPAQPKRQASQGERRMLTATCHCGAVRVDVPRRPRSLTNCNCSVCRRYGTLWCLLQGLAGPRHRRHRRNQRVFLGRQVAAVRQVWNLRLHHPLGANSSGERKPNGRQRAKF